MPLAAADIDMSLNENTRGMALCEGPIVHLLMLVNLVLGQDPLIPPDLLQAEIPAV